MITRSKYFRLWTFSLVLLLYILSPAQPHQAYTQQGKVDLKILATNESYFSNYSFLDEAITLSMKNVPLKKALIILSDKTHIKFSYSSNIIDTTKEISFMAENATVTKVLNLAFTGKDIGWIPLEDRTVVLTTQNRASEETGTMKGKVFDGSTNEALIGVNIVIQGTSLGTATDIEGQFRIVGIPIRIFSIKISCLGYEPTIMEIDFTKTKDVSLNIPLKPAVIQGEEVVVTGQMRGQIAAINQQLTANTIVNVVSEEKIKELPDANAAEAIGRLPGVALKRSGGEASQVVLRGMSGGFSNITIDGVRIPPTDANSRDVDLSMMSQSSLAGIELYKALTPDKDADAIAGSVNLVTKDAPAERFIQIALKGAYEKLDNTLQQYDISAKYGERFFNDILGVQVSANLEQRVRSDENYSIDYDNSINNGTDYVVNDFTLQYINEVRKRSGVNTIFDFKTPDNGSIKLSNLFNRTNRNYITYGRDYPTGMAGTNTGNPVYSIRDQEEQIDNFNSSLHGKNYLFGITANWGFSFAQSKGSYPYDYYMDFEESSSSNSGMKLPIKPQDAKNPDALIQYAYNNFSAANIVWANYNTQDNLDKERTVNLDLSKEYTIGNLFSGEWKLGGKYRIKNRMKDVSELTNQYQIMGFNMAGKDFSGTRFQNLQLGTGGRLVLMTNFLDPTPASRDLYGKYPLYPLINVDALRLWYDLNKNGVNGTIPEYQPNYFIGANSYDITERVSAGYIMNTMNFSQDVTLIAGVRVEQENNDYGSKFSPQKLSGFPTVSGILQDTMAHYNETIWLPNAHLTLKPLSFMNVRVAAYRALARPDFNYRLELFNAQDEGSTVQRGDKNPNLSVGNSQLADAKAWNYEISTSFYGNTIGLLTLSAYYKNIKDMYHLAGNIRVDAANGQSYLDSVGLHWTNVFGSPAKDYYITYPYNSSQPTYVWGFEIEHQLSLSFLPWLLKNFVLSYNVSIVRSETYIRSYVLYDKSDTTYFRGQPIINTTQHAKYIDLKEKLEGQPELFGNVALGYDIGSFSARVSLFFQSEYTKYYSADSREDLVVNSLSRWDISLKYQISKSIAATFNMNNLTNAADVVSLKDNIYGWTLVQTSESYGLTGDFGLQITF
jgi:TonB-dependent receptor